MYLRCRLQPRKKALSWLGRLVAPRTWLPPSLDDGTRAGCFFPMHQKMVLSHRGVPLHNLLHLLCTTKHKSSACRNQVGSHTNEPSWSPLADFLGVVMWRGPVLTSSLSLVKHTSHRPVAGGALFLLLAVRVTSATGADGVILSKEALALARGSGFVGD